MNVSQSDSLKRYIQAVKPVMSRTAVLSNDGYWIRKYYVPGFRPLGPPPQYHLFNDRMTGQALPFMVHQHKNPHVLFAGRARVSGKTTAAEHLLYHEVERGAFPLIFDPKGEYFRIPMPINEDEIFRAGFGSWDSPPKIKPSTMTYEMWKPLVERYLLGKGYKSTVTILMKAIKELKKTGKEITFDGMLVEINALSKEKTGISQREWLSIKFQIEDFFDTLTELELFSEEEGVDVRFLLENYKAAVFSTKAPEDVSHLSLLVSNILQQLFRLKTDSDTRRGKGDPKMWARRIFIVIEEAGDPATGLVNMESTLDCRHDVEQVFGKYGYANVMGMAVTQLLQNVSTKVIGNCGNVFVGRLDEPNAVKKVSQLSGITQGYLEELFKTFEVGDFFDPFTMKTYRLQPVPGFVGGGG